MPVTRTHFEIGYPSLSNGQMTQACSVSKIARKNSRGRKDEIAEEILAGGFAPAFLMESENARREWFAAYRQTYLERDLLNTTSGRSNTSRISIAC